MRRLLLVVDSTAFRDVIVVVGKWEVTEAGTARATVHAFLIQNDESYFNVPAKQAKNRTPKALDHASISLDDPFAPKKKEQPPRCCSSL